MTQDDTTMPVMVSDTAALVGVAQAARDAAEKVLDLADNCCCDICTDLATDIIARAINEAELRGARLMQEAAAKKAASPGFIEARDSEWDVGVCYAKRLISTLIRALDPATIIARATLTETGR